MSYVYLGKARAWAEEAQASTVVSATVTAREYLAKCGWIGDLIHLIPHKKTFLTGRIVLDDPSIEISIKGSMNGHLWGYPSFLASGPWEGKVGLPEKEAKKLGGLGVPRWPEPPEELVQLPYPSWVRCSENQYSSLESAWCFKSEAEEVFMGWALPQAPNFLKLLHDFVESAIMANVCQPTPKILGELVAKYPATKILTQTVQIS